MSLRSPLFRLCCALLAVGCLLTPAVSAQDAARTVSDTVPLDADGEVIIANHEGRITIETWDRAEVRFDIRIMPSDDDPEAEKTTIDINRSDRRLRLTTTHEDGDDESKVFGFSLSDGWRWGGIDIPAVHYTLTMPTTAHLMIDDHESTIDVTGLHAEARIDTHDGTIHLADHRGNARLDSHDGPMDVRGMTGDLQIDTHDGRINVAEHAGDVIIDSHDSSMNLRDITGYLEVDTHEADLTVNALRGGLRFDSHDGEADISFAELTDDVDIDTHDGWITLHLASNAAFDLWTDFNDDVDLDTDFDLSSIRIANDDDDEVNYRGAVNDGGPRMRLSAHDGDFALRIR